MEWISVKDRLPAPKYMFDRRGWYLVALSNGAVKEARFEFWDDEDAMFDYGWEETAYPVTHWMPLPDPPVKDCAKCGDCKHFLGCGDWHLCCELDGGLYYEDTIACSSYEPKEWAK